LKIEEIRALSVEELAKQLEAAHQELFSLRFRLATKQLVNHREIPRVEKKIARLKTVMRERELGIITSGEVLS
jgi:large subunit ribosomal protein L29